MYSLSLKTWPSPETIKKCLNNSALVHLEWIQEIHLWPDHFINFSLVHLTLFRNFKKTRHWFFIPFAFFANDRKLCWKLLSPTTPFDVFYCPFKQSETVQVERGPDIPDLRSAPPRFTSRKHHLQGTTTRESLLTNFYDALPIARCCRQDAKTRVPLPRLINFGELGLLLSLSRLCFFLLYCCLNKRPLS